MQGGETVNKSYKFRIYPSKEQEILINKTFGCVRFIYNIMLSDKIKCYKENKTMLTNTPAQYKQEFEWLKEVDAFSLCNAQLHLKRAYTAFFNKKDAGFPKFKSKKRSKLSYTTNNNKNSIYLSEDLKYIKLPKLKQLRIKCHRQIGENELIKSVTVSKTSTGKYYASILVEYEKEIVSKPSEKVVGLDFSMKELYYSSENEIANYPRYFRQSQEKLAKEQRKLSRKKKGSNNRNKQRIKVAKIHEHVANQRKDFLHKKSRELVDEFDAVCIEDLNMKAMSQCLNFGKSVYDNGWGMFAVFLSYKLALEGKQLTKIDKWFPSSKLCSRCGILKDDLKLSDRTYKCKECGLIIDRDYNASLNIKRVGITQLAW
jgi:putative transposase